MDDRRTREQFDIIGNLPEAWRWRTEDLLRSAEVLREHRTDAESRLGRDSEEWKTHPPELMLRGVALECLLKALWVKQGNNLAEDGRFVSIRDTSHHDLVQLARAVGLTVSEIQEDLLRRLSRFATDGGRYPIPKSHEKLRLIPSPGGGMADALTWTTPRDYATFDSIVTLLNELLDAP